MASARERIDKRIEENTKILIKKCSKKELAWMLAAWPTNDAIKILNNVSAAERKKILEEW